MKVDLEELRLLAMGATPGPWTYQDSGIDASVGEDEFCHVVSPMELKCVSDSNGAFIAAACPDVVLEMIRRLRFAEALITLLSPKPGDLVVITVPDDVLNDFASYEALRTQALSIFRETHAVVAVKEGFRIETMDEDKMRSLGWVRAPA